MYPNKIEEISEKKLKIKTVAAFSVFVLFFVFVIVGWNTLNKQPKDNEALQPLRKVMNFDEIFFGRFYSADHLAKTFPLSRASKQPRVNGSDGLSEDFDPSTWKLKIARNRGDTLAITLEDIKKLPKTEIIFDFKCIEGWSEITHWAGVKFSDFADHYHLSETREFNYVGLITPDKGYYVGVDMASMLHPQTLLCYEMNGKPLPMNQGYPLRLIIPVKYGIKHLKRIGTISFSNERPPDFWYERGYDYYSGL